MLRPYRYFWLTNLKTAVSYLPKCFAPTSLNRQFIIVSPKILKPALANAGAGFTNHGHFSVIILADKFAINEFIQ
jgi:hypothetical protein